MTSVNIIPLCNRNNHNIHNTNLKILKIIPKKNASNDRKIIDFLQRTKINDLVMSKKASRQLENGKREI